MTASLEEPRRFATMPAVDAREVFDEFVRLHPRRVDDFLAAVGRRGGPLNELDLSVGSLEPLWEWFVRAHRHRWYSSDPYRMPRHPLRLDEVRPDDPIPWWAPFHPGFYLELGPRLATLIEGFSAYVFESMLRAHPGSRWAMGKGRSNASFQAPVLQLEGRGEVDYGGPIVTVLHGLRGEHGTDRPDQLRIGVERWVGMDLEWDVQMAALSRPVAPFAVGPCQHPHFTHVISFDDRIGHQQSARIDRLVGRLASENGIEAAVREDREVVLLRAPEMEADSLLATVDRAWRAAWRP